MRPWWRENLGQPLEVVLGIMKECPQGVVAEWRTPQDAADIKKKLKDVLEHEVIHADVAGKKITTMGIITGGANSQWKDAFYQGLDSYLTGEISEHDWHDASEAGIHFFAGGHNATEQFGVQGLMNHLKEQFQIECAYFHSDNPALRRIYALAASSFSFFDFIGLIRATIIWPSKQ